MATKDTRPWSVRRKRPHPGNLRQCRVFACQATDDEVLSDEVGEVLIFDTPGKLLGAHVLNREGLNWNGKWGT